MNTTNSTSVNTGGGAFNVVGGVVGGSGNTAVAETGAVTLDNQVSPAAARQELEELLAALRQQLDGADDLPAEARADLTEDLESADRALKREQPDAERAATRLQSMKKVLDGLGAGLTSAVALGGTVARALAMVGKLVGLG